MEGMGFGWGGVGSWVWKLGSSMVFCGFIIFYDLLLCLCDELDVWLVSLPKAISWRRGIEANFAEKK